LNYLSTISKIFINEHVKSQHEILNEIFAFNLIIGLGKTFIAAVVMYNFWRWYPFSKIVFLAPTKPLVAQQIDACYEIMGIPSIDMIILTGFYFNIYIFETL